MDIYSIFEGIDMFFNLYFFLKVRLEKECSMTTKRMLELEVCLNLKEWTEGRHQEWSP